MNSTQARGAAASAAVVLLAAVSCSSTSGEGQPVRISGTPPGAAPASSSGPAPSDLTALTRHVTCPTAPSRVPPARLAAFRSVTAITCGEDSRQLPGEGQWAVYVRKVATAGTPALQRAFELPEEPSGHGACTSNLIVVPPLVLVDAAGQTLAPTPPTGVCGKPLEAFLQALRHVSWREVAVRKVRQLETPQAQAAGCSTRWKNEVAINSQAGVHVSSGGDLFGQPPKVAHVCLYRDTGADPDAGDFESGFALTEADSAELAKALAGPGRATGCLPQQEFAVINFAGVFANVELGGCWRVQRPTGGIGAADALVVKKLLHIH